MAVALHQIADVLDSIETSEELMKDLILDRFNKSTKFVIAALAKFSDQERVSQVLDLYAELDKGYQARLLVSAELGEVLNEMPLDSVEDASPKQLDHIYDIIAREHAIFNFEKGVETEYLKSTSLTRLFSPLGDRSLVKTGSAWHCHQGYLVDDVIAIDFDSPLATKHEPDSGTLSRDWLEHTEAEKQEVVKKFNLALKNIDRAAPVHGQIIRNFVRRIIVRKTVESAVVFEDVGIDQAPFGSEHRPIHPSSLRALNVHHPQKSITACMETLFHETIHNMLAYWEIVNGHFAPSSRTVRPISPWTSNPIPNHSFAHAVFVWYGLHRLFEGVIENISDLQQVDEGDARQRLATFALGYLIGKPLSAQFCHTEAVQEDLKFAIDKMQFKIVDQYGEMSGSSLEAA